MAIDKVDILHLPEAKYVRLADFDHVCRERDAARENAETQRAAAAGYRAERDEAREQVAVEKLNKGELRDYCAEYRRERDDARALVAEMADELDPELPGYRELFDKVKARLARWEG